MKVELKVLLAVLVSIVTIPVPAEDSSFDGYLRDVARQARETGISAATIERAFDGLEVDPRVIGFDRRQPEFVQTFDEYLTARVSDFRIEEGRRLYVEHRTQLEEIGGVYGVDPEYIVAFWGLETSFGRYQGKYSIVRSLATLGHDPRRSAFFTAELIKALQILDEGHVSFENFVGAWAGAMGQSQFMPSSFLSYAVDYNGDGRKDIWASEEDVFASIANYLSSNKWQPGGGWGAKAVLKNPIDLESLRPEKYDTRCRALKHHTRKLGLDKWRDLGVGYSDNLPDQAYALIIPDSKESRTYLVGGNFRTILSYNCANKYAVSVGILAEKIMGQDTDTNRESS